MDIKYAGISIPLVRPVIKLHWNYWVSFMSVARQIVEFLRIPGNLYLTFIQFTSSLSTVFSYVLTLLNKTFLTSTEGILK